LFRERAVEMKKTIEKTVLILTALSILFCCSCETVDQAAANTQAVNTSERTIHKETAAAPEVAVSDEPAAIVGQANVPELKQKSPKDVVAQIGDYRITRKELDKMILSESFQWSIAGEDEVVTVDAKDVLLRIMTEKALLLQARDNKQLDNPYLKFQVGRYRNEILTETLMNRYLEENLVATDAEIDQKLKSNPELTRKNARNMILRKKKPQVVEKYYTDLLDKIKVKKVKENYALAVKANYKMLTEAMSQKPVKTWIQVRQVVELPQEVKDTTLVTHDLGVVTIEDLFAGICELSPPSRPENLNSYKAFNEILDNIMRMYIFAAQAVHEGIDKEDSFIRKVRDREDLLLLNSIKPELYKLAKVPTEDEVKAYFEKHKDRFLIPRSVRIDNIWCNSRETAVKAKQELDAGGDFEQVKQQYTIDKRLRASYVNPKSENIFFNDIWAVEPNDIIGPIKGFHRNDLKWRVVKVLEKNNAKPAEFSNDIVKSVKDVIRTERFKAVLDKRRQELFLKFPYKIDYDVLKTVDPLGIQ
jgi:peptidyl-prolyl cis-trans isomerase C